METGIFPLGEVWALPSRAHALEVAVPVARQGQLAGSVRRADEGEGSPEAACVTVTGSGSCWEVLTQVSGLMRGDGQGPRGEHLRLLGADFSQQILRYVEL